MMKQTQICMVFAFFLFTALACDTADNPISEVKELETLELGQGLNIGSPAPEFQLLDGYGNLHALSSYLGDNKKVIIVFFRTGG